VTPHAGCLTAIRLSWDLYSSQLCHNSFWADLLTVTICRLALINSKQTIHFPPQVNTQFAVSYKEQSSFGQIIVVDCENHRNTVCGQNTAFINVRAGGTDSYQWALNDSDQRRAQRCVAIYPSLLLPTHSTGLFYSHSE